MKNKKKFLDFFLILVSILAFLTIVIFFLFYEYQAINNFTFVIDDVWIHLKFAKNIADGYGFSFNRGELISASTAPLYTLILAAMFIISQNIIFNIYSISLISSILIVFFYYKISFLLTNNRFFSFIMTLLLSLNPWFTWSALSGMEIILGSLLLIIALYLYLLNKKSLTVLFISLGTLIRPETYSILILFFLIEILDILFDKNNTKLLLLNLVKNIIITLLIILPYGLFCIYTTGSFFPNTYTAKVGDLGLFGILNNNFNNVDFLKKSLFLINSYLENFLNSLKKIDIFSYFFMPVSSLIFLYKFLKEFKTRYLFLPVIFLFFPLIVGIIVPNDRVSWPWNRHMLYLLPLYLIFVFTGFYWLVNRKYKIFLVIGVVFLILTQFIFFKRNILEVKNNFVKMTSLIYSQHLKMAQWVKKNLSDKEIIAASDIGVLGFYTNNYIVDTEGLINPKIKTFKYRRNSLKKDMEIYEYLSKVKPNYLVKFVWVYPNFTNYQFPIINKFGTFAIYKTPWTR